MFTLDTNFDSTEEDAYNAYSEFNPFLPNSPLWDLKKPSTPSTNTSGSFPLIDRLRSLGSSAQNPTWTGEAINPSYWSLDNNLFNNQNVDYWQDKNTNDVYDTGERYNEGAALSTMAPAISALPSIGMTGVVTDKVQNILNPVQNEVEDYQSWLDTNGNW